MNRREFIQGAAGAELSLNAGATERRRPNIILIHGRRYGLLRYRVLWVRDRHAKP